MSTHTFSQPYQVLMVGRMDRLIGALIARGLTKTFISKVVGGNPTWVRDYQIKKFRVDTYDDAAARISAIWPEGVAWPSDIPRPEPSEIDPATLAEVAGRLEKFRNRSEARHG